MKELLDFAIECRKRVKLQLQNMDETFEEVDFSYTIRETGERVTIDTLEVLEHLAPIKPVKIDDKASDSNEDSSPKIETKKEKVLSGGQKIIRDNQTGVSYNLLFGDYLIGATDIKLIDPYIRLPYQLRNFMEFAKLIAEKKDPEVEVKLHLVTSNNLDYIEGAREAFEQMTLSFESIGIIFTYEFNENIHDRSILLNNGWKILLGRGLDLWQKTGGWYDVNEYIQEKRLCKACEVTILLS